MGPCPTLGVLASPDVLLAAGGAVEEKLPTIGNDPARELYGEVRGADESFGFEEIPGLLVDMVEGLGRWLELQIPGDLIALFRERAMEAIGKKSTLIHSDDLVVGFARRLPGIVGEIAH